VSKLSGFNSEDIKSQLSEYHLVVAEVVGGISFDLIEAKKKLAELESQHIKVLEELKELKAVTRLLVQASLPRQNNG
jgi:hypothetical protein